MSRKRQNNELDHKSLIRQMKRVMEFVEARCYGLKQYKNYAEENIEYGAYKVNWNKKIGPGVVDIRNLRQIIDKLLDTFKKMNSLNEEDNLQIEIVLPKTGSVIKSIWCKI
jgi:hypothetical protein